MIHDTSNKFFKAAFNILSNKVLLQVHLKIFIFATSTFTY